ncbi:MAG: response regulator [Chloroflexi bacterium]|nr:response regulator [Chloroflexota bacterium]
MNNPQTPPKKGDILIVDDTPHHLHALSQILIEETYKVRSVSNGAHAIQTVQENPPDLILLDIMMPKMDGYQVCERLKADEQTHDIPIIFISALDLTQDKIKAFAVGGVDYVTKPFQIEEVLTRVETHITLRTAQKQLEKREQKLQVAVEQRTAELVTVNEQLEQEIGERKQAERAAQDSESRFRTLFENAPLCIFEIDLTQMPPTIVRANYRATQVYGWSPQEIVPAPLNQIVPQDAMPEVAQVVDALRIEKTITIESVNQHRDGSLFPVRINASSAATSDSNHVILVVEDITAEKTRRSEKEAVEEERRRIAQEIHDGLAQNLAALRFRVRQWHKLVDTDPPQMHAELDELRQILSDSIIEVRRSIFALRPIALEKRGFFPALHLFVTGFGKHYQVRVNLNISGPRERVPASLELALIRIVQEALNNVGKHAQASAVWITLDIQVPDTTTVTNVIALTIRDDGKGFDQASLDHAVEYGHFGLKQMRERVEQVNGTLAIQSQPGGGTRIQVTLPLNNIQSARDLDVTSPIRR